MLDDNSSESIDRSPRNSQPTLAHLTQLRALYSLTTALTSRCFTSCITRIGPRLEEGDKACINGCVANMIQMRMLFSRRMQEAAKEERLV